MDIPQAKKIMGSNFIGPEELEKIASKLNIINLKKIKHKVPQIHFSEQVLKEVCKDCILILGIPTAQDGEKLTLNKLRSHLGYDPKKSEPCFYNQDWYLKERFAEDETLDFKWYLIKKSVDEKSRGKHPKDIIKDLGSKEKLPSAVLTAFVFFAYYFLYGEILWKHDFVWCCDRDTNNDQIYTGYYIDPERINKNGFNIHRYLTIRPCFGVAIECKEN